MGSVKVIPGKMFSVTGFIIITQLCVAIPRQWSGSPCQHSVFCLFSCPCLPSCFPMNPSLGVHSNQLQGQRDLTKACVRELIFLSREGRDLGVAFQAPPGSQASSRGEAKDSALLSSRDAGLLEPPSGVNGVKPPLHFGERARDYSPGYAGKEGQIGRAHV